MASGSFRRQWIGAFAIGAILGLGQSAAAWAQATPKGAAPAPKPAQAAPASPAPSAKAEPSPVVPPFVDQLLKETGDYLGSAAQFTFHADVTFDHVLPSGQKLQFSAAEDVALQRSGRLYVEWVGDLGARQLWYDGKTVTLYDPVTAFYASAAMPSNLDGMLDSVLKRLDFAPPLADFLYSQPYKSVRGNIQYGFDLGGTDVNGKSCRTLAFVEKSVDWQIWIEEGAQPTPCKLVITYKSLPAQPQFTAVFSDWDFAPRIDAAVFTPTLPADAQKIPFATVAAAK